MVATPISEATRSVEATIPWGARAGSRQAASVSVVVRQTEEERDRTVAFTTFIGSSSYANASKTGEQIAFAVAAALEVAAPYRGD